MLKCLGGLVSYASSLKPLTINCFVLYADGIQYPDIISGS